MAVGVIAIITKIHRWDESAMFFDGGSLGTWATYHPHTLNPFKLIWGTHTLSLRSAHGSEYKTNYLFWGTEHQIR